MRANDYQDNWRFSIDGLLLLAVLGRDLPTGWWKMIRNENDLRGEGMHISRTIDGEIVRMDRLDPAIEKRIDKIADLNTQYVTLTATNDADGLFELAKKYDALKMHTMANKIRKQVNE